MQSFYVIHLLYFIYPQYFSLPFAQGGPTGRTFYTSGHRGKWQSQHGMFNGQTKMRLRKQDYLQFKVLNNVWNTQSTDKGHNYQLKSLLSIQTTALQTGLNRKQKPASETETKKQQEKSSLNRAQNSDKKMIGFKSAEMSASVKAECIVKCCCDLHKQESRNCHLHLVSHFLF